MEIATVMESTKRVRVCLPYRVGGPFFSDFNIPNKGGKWMDTNMSELSLEVEKVIETLKEAQRHTFTFLLIGRTGVGKSSTINALLGECVAPVGHFRPQTESVENYTRTINDINFVVVDTPGLCDDLPESGNDAVYLKKIQKEAPEIDCLLFVTPLNATRVNGDEKRAIRLISEAFGKDVWHHAVIVFTFAESVEASRYSWYLRNRTQLIRHEIRDQSPPDTRYRTIASVAISNRQGTSDRKQGLNELYMTVCKSVSRTSFRHFYLGTVSRLANEKKNGNPNTKNASENIVLTDENRTDMRDIITEDPVLRILKSIGSSAIGYILGGLPAAVLSGVIGTGIEFIVDLFSD